MEALGFSYDQVKWFAPASSSVFEVAIAFLLWRMCVRHGSAALASFAWLSSCVIALMFALFPPEANDFGFRLHLSLSAGLVLGYLAYTSIRWHKRAKSDRIEPGRVYIGFYRGRKIWGWLWSLIGEPYARMVYHCDGVTWGVYGNNWTWRKEKPSGYVWVKESEDVTRWRETMRLLENTLITKYNYCLSQINKSRKMRELPSLGLFPALARKKIAP